MNVFAQWFEQKRNRKSKIETKANEERKYCESFTILCYFSFFFFLHFITLEMVNISCVTFGAHDLTVLFFKLNLFQS